MRSRTRRGRRALVQGLALASALSIVPTPGAATPAAAQEPRPTKLGRPRLRAIPRANAVLAPPLLPPPPGYYQGFGLGFHLGYGFGGAAQGVGPDGGYPFYGGPGYPHPAPCLRRIGGIAPFPYFGGPGFPTPENPNVFGPTGPLIPDQPVVVIDENSPESAAVGDYGAYTGTLPYPESTFAPFTAEAASPGPGGPRDQPMPGAPMPSPGLPSPLPADDPEASRTNGLDRSTLGIKAVPVLDLDGTGGMKVIRVEPGKAADKAGIRVGDVIRSIDGQATRTPSDLEKILSNAEPDHQLALNVRLASPRRPHDPGATALTDGQPLRAWHQSATETLRAFERLFMGQSF